MIKINNLEFSYQKDKELFKNFNCQFNEGSIIGLLGKNGVGKTTLLKLISGLIFPKKGSTIEVNGFVPTERKPDFLSNVYYIPEVFIPERYGRTICKHLHHSTQTLTARNLTEFQNLS